MNTEKAVKVSIAYTCGCVCLRSHRVYVNHAAAVLLVLLAEGFIYVCAVARPSLPRGASVAADTKLHLLQGYEHETR